MSSCPDPGAIQGFVEEDGLDPAVRAELEQHVADCHECRQLVAALTSSMTAPTVTDSSSRSAQTTPAAIGRYEIAEVLGAGGMGIVYAANDPKLRRKVAIKLLRAGAGAGEDTREAQARLLREARAMAKVHHPNVVSVFDTGEHGDEVFVAMELVTGGTLRRWLTTRERSVGEILDAFLEAGRGLAAAHAAGLVHRDFKPDNVLVGDDRRVRVTDFGLARHPGGRQVSHAERGETAARSLRLTATGAVHGTPGYIAPEQYAHQTFDARSDQFAFCVSLWEALDRKRPYRGDDHVAIEDAVTSGRISEPTEGRIPRPLRRVLERGLAVDPAQRWPDLEALLAAIAAARPRSKKLLIAIAITTTAIAAAAVTVVAISTRADQRAEPPARLAAEEERLNALLLSGDRDGGAKYADELVARFDKRDADQAAAQNLRGYAHYYNGELEEATRVLIRAIALADELDEKHTKAVATGTLVHALEDLGELAEAKRWSEMVVASAGAANQSHVARAGALDSQAHRVGRHDLVAGLELYQRAAGAWALAGDLDGWAANRSMLARSFINQLQHDLGCALTYATFATLDVVGPGARRNARVEASLANGGAVCEVSRGRPEASLGFARRAVDAISNGLGPNSPDLASPLLYLGRAAAHAGDLAASEQAFDRLVRLPLTPRELITNLGVMAVTAFETGRLEIAVKRADHLVELAEKEYPKDHPELFAHRLLLAKLLVRSRQFARATPMLEELRIAYERLDDPIMLADVRFALAKSVRDTDAKRARALAEQARDAYRAAGSVRALHLGDVEQFLAGP